jgi:hypothetical protein
MGDKCAPEALVFGLATFPEVRAAAAALPDELAIWKNAFASPDQQGRGTTLARYLMAEARTGVDRAFANDEAEDIHLLLRTLKRLLRSDPRLAPLEAVICIAGVSQNQKPCLARHWMELPADGFKPITLLAVPPDWQSGET